ncbi:MAG: response regulator transcription factor [Hyphomonadaceae bacterium]|nr:response regulator transcription factor [Hyphomonadaceae bacterium]
MASAATGRSIVVVEDDPAIRKAFCEMIARDPELVLAGSAGTLADAEALFVQPPDAALVDLMLPDGNAFALISQLTETSQTKVIVISVLGDEQAVVTAFRAGASGYLLKGATGFQLRDAILQTLDGHIPISPSVARYVINQLSAPSGQDGVDETEVSLSPRERDVLYCLAAGSTDKETARQLGVSPHTVAAYLKTVFRKLEVKTRAAAVARALTEGRLPDYPAREGE